MDDGTSIGWRGQLRATRVGALLLKAVVLVVGAFFIAVGVVLVVLPGPLTIPPVLLGVYIWSTEFAWAERLRLLAAAKSRVTWAAARRKPVHSTVATLSGLVLVAAGVVAIRRHDVLARILGNFG